MKKRTGYVVPHTHWDREWRYPIWENRMYLVNLVDELLENLESNPEYKSFLFDGQTVAMRDYLEVRPENEEKLMKLIREERILVGPWFTLPDLYPLSGESLVRNLLKGVREAESYGKCLKIGYESFGWGQTAQFPQIYKGFGIDTVIIAKNVDKSRAPQCEFAWEGVDGTKVYATRLGVEARANFFMNAYIPVMNGIPYKSDDYQFDWGKGGLVYHQADGKGHIQDYFKLENTEKLHTELVKECVMKAWHAMDESLLPEDRILMNGSDSTTSQPAMMNIIEEANRQIIDIEFKSSSIEEYVNLLKSKLVLEELPVVQGELRDGPTTSLSGNALMTRPHIKMLNKKVQNALFNSAEPFSVVNHLLGNRYDRNFLDKSIEYLLLSHPHDSINGVTQDKTVEDVFYTLNQALEISHVVYNKDCQEIIKQIDTSVFDQEDMLVVIFNPLPITRREIVQAYIDTPQNKGVWDFSLEDEKGSSYEVQHISREQVTIPVCDPHSRPWPYYADRHCILFDTGEIPAGGYKVYKVCPGANFSRKTVFWPQTRKTKGDELATSTHKLENEFVGVQMNSNGTINLIDKTTGKTYNNLNYLESTGDIGDYWMYYPTYNNKTFTSLGANADIWLEENGPLSATIGAEIHMQLPAYAHRPENAMIGASKRAEETKDVTVKVWYTLKKGEKKVDVKLSVDNTVEDHKMSVLFDTGIQTRTIDAAGHFNVDHRPVTPLRDKDGQYYNELTSQPMQNFVDVSDGTHGFGIVNNCMVEYDPLNNEEGTIALTLFRAVRNIICTEWRSAGVFPDQKGGQLQQTLTYEYALCPHQGDWQQANLFTESSRLNVPVKVVQTNVANHVTGTLPREKSFYSVDEQLVMSAMKLGEDTDHIILRVYNPHEQTVKGQIKIDVSIKEAYLTNLNEERIETIDKLDDNTLEIVAEPNKIYTLEIIK
ncbi:MAG: glycoside hydrolase family 38 C-terminal domain-containing protein [Niameybacter sp.]